MAQGGTSNIFVNPEPQKKNVLRFFQQKDVQKRGQMAGKNSSQLFALATETSSNRNSMGSTDVEVSSQNINCQKNA